MTENWFDIDKKYAIMTNKYAIKTDKYATNSVAYWFESK